MKDNFNIADWRHDFLFEDLLVEADAKILKVKKIIEKNFKGVLDVNGPVASSEYYVNGKSDTTWMQYLVSSVRHYFGLMSNDRSILDLLPVVANLAFGELKLENFGQDLKKLRTLRRAVTEAVENVGGEDYGWFLEKGYNLTYQDILDRFANRFASEDVVGYGKANDDTDRVRNVRYKIIPIKTYAKAREWGKYNGLKNGKEALCYATSNGIWDTYTEDGENSCFLLLRDDWKETPAEKTKGYPKDSYGLSMVWVFVSKFSGELAYSNVRWNHGDHSYNNVDHMFTPSEIADLLGMSYNKAFSINVDKDYFNKSLQALFDNNLNVAKQYFRLIVPVYEGY